MSDQDEMMAGLSGSQVNDLIVKSSGWQSRALAAEQERDKALALVASYDRQDELIGTEFEGVDEVTEVIRLLKQERDHKLREEIKRLHSEKQTLQQAIFERDKTFPWMSRVRPSTRQ